MAVVRIVFLHCRDLIDLCLFMSRSGVVGETAEMGWTPILQQDEMDGTGGPANFEPDWSFL